MAGKDHDASTGYKLLHAVWAFSAKLASPAPMPRLVQDIGLKGCGDSKKKARLHSLQNRSHSMSRKAPRPVNSAMSSMTRAVSFVPRPK